jgi:hypothetical protein
MINKLNKLAIALMVAGATATATTALARTTNTFTNAVQTLTIDLKMYKSGSSKVIPFTDKNLILAVSNNANLPSLSNAPAAAFTKNPEIVISTTYGSVITPHASLTGTNTVLSTNVVTNINFVAVPAFTTNVTLAATNALPILLFASSTNAFVTNSTGVPTNGTELIIGSTTNGAVITNMVGLTTNYATNYATNTMIVGTNVTVMVSTNVETNTALTTNLVLIATNGWTATNALSNNVLLTNAFFAVGTNGLTNSYSFLTNYPTPTNLATAASNYFTTISLSNFTTTNFGFGTNTAVTNLVFTVMTNSAVTLTNVSTNVITNTVLIYTTNYTTNVSITDVGTEIQGGSSTNYQYAGLDSLVYTTNLLSVIISTNASGTVVEYQADKFTIGAFSTNGGTNNVSLTLHGFVQLTSKDDVLATHAGVKTEIPNEDTFTATVNGYGYIGGTYSTNAYSATNSTSFALPASTDTTNGSVVGATPVVVEGTISLGAPKNIGQY